MSYSRFRVRGPTYTPKTLRMTYDQWVTYPPPSRWVPMSSMDRYYPDNSTSLLLDKAICYDEIHRRTKGVYREGGPFFLKTMSTEIVGSPYGVYANKPYRYSGHFVCTPVTTEVTNAYNGYAETAATWGATAWNKFRPVKPSADLGQFLGELRDFTSMFRIRLRSFRDLGGQYLNYRFGWAPFIRDILKVVDLQKKLEKRIAFARKNNGKWIRRGGTVLNDAQSTTTSLSGYLFPTLNTYFWPNIVPNQSTKVVTTTDRIWFKALMKYYIPKLNVDSASKIWTSSLLQKLYGFELSPSVLWELMPWSWFQDWFLNIGDVMANLSNSAYDNLVAKYSYVMRHRTYKVVLLWRGEVKTDIGIVQAGPCISTTKAECKERAEASEWGFGQLGADDLSTRQWLILGALGISRFPKI